MKKSILILFVAVLFLSSTIETKAAIYSSSINITNSTVTTNSIQLSFSEVSLSSGDEYFMGCAELNVALGIDAPSYTISGTSSPLKIQNLKSGAEYNCNVMIHLSDDSYVSPSQSLRLKTYPSALTISNQVVTTNSIQLSFSEVSLSSGDEYFMGCAELNVALGIDAPSYTKSGTSSPLKIQNLKSGAEYDCNVFIHLSDDSYVSPSQSLRLKTTSTTSSITTSATSTTSSSTKTSTNLPPAGYEDEVLTTFDSNPFPDTNISDLEGKAAAELYRRAVIGGFPDGEFKGSRNVNRAEAAKFLLQALYDEVYETANNGKFWDVKEGEWYVKYVMVAAIKGVIEGYPDGSFRPADTVNTAEFLKMLTKTFGLSENLGYSYSDVSNNAWYARYAGIAEKYNLFPERSEYLYPASELSRKDVAIAIYQYLLNR